jgi:hypothetical protein
VERRCKSLKSWGRDERYRLQRGFHPSRNIFVAAYIVVVCPINKEADVVFGSYSNKISERSFNGLGIFEPDNHVCVYEKLELAHPSTTRCTLG